MKFFKFKSLAIKIWITFSIIILIIICSSSVLYIGVFRSLEENAKIGDLKLSHDILLTNNNFNNPVNRLDEMKNLKDSKHCILNISTDNKMYITDIKQKKHIIFIISSIKSTNTGRSYLISYMKDSKDNSVLYMVVGIGIVFIVLGFFIAKVVANYISRTLKELEAFTLRIAHKNWNEPINVSSEDEFGRLTSAMNEMQEALKHADEEEKLFLQSISHDLKTPVMVIMSHAEAIIDGVYIESVENTAEIIKSEAINLQKKIKQLLYLNTLDYMLQNNKENTEVNLQDILLKIITRFKVVNSKIIWEVETCKIYIYGNIEKIQAVVENILDNQLRYAKEKIFISLKEKEECAILEIYNDGPNIGEKHINHIFDNLYKDKTGNFGLGLAICKKIITFYKGEIRAVNREQGVSFIIKLPCSIYPKL